MESMIPTETPQGTRSPAAPRCEREDGRLQDRRGEPVPARACDHHAPGHTKGRPLMDERTASDLRFRTVGTTGFEPATP